MAAHAATNGGHFWVGAAGTAKSIQYVGDVGGTPLFQDELAFVETLGPVSGVAFNPGSGFTITQPHPNGPIVRDASGRKVVIDGLWGLQFGNGASLGEANHMYFTAGPEKETQGLFGKLQANPNTLPILGGISLCK